jgi:WD40 repeat protein
VVAFRSNGFVLERSPAHVANDTLAAGCSLDPTGHRVARIAARELQIFDVADAGKPVAAIPLDGARRVTLAPGGHRVVADVRAGELAVFDDGKRTATWTAPPAIDDRDAFAFSSDGAALLVGAHEANELWVIDAATGGATKLAAPRVTTARWSADGGRLVAAGEDGVVRVWTARGALLATLKHAASVADVAIAGDAVFTACDDGEVRQWTLAGALVRETRVTRGRVLHLALEPHARWFASESDQREVAVWSVATGDALERLAAGNENGGLEFSRDGARLLLIADGRVRQWDMRVDAHDAAQLDALVGKFVPWVVLDGRLEPRTR